MLGHKERCENRGEESSEEAVVVIQGETVKAWTMKRSGRQRGRNT